MSVRASIPVDLGERGYSITIGDGLIDQAGQQIAPLLRNDDVILVTDENVNQTAHPARLIQALHSKGVTCRPFVVPAGEASKDFATWQKLTSDILNARIDRKTSVIALGGGVVGDLAGFAAAALLRGLDFFQVPTSLLAMVDSSVGGKTGINAPAGKNLLGAFHQPRHVLIDTSVLADLPARELRCGYAELVKHALIRDAQLFAWLDGRVEQLMRNDDPALIAEAIDRSVRIKAAIVGEDERETSGTRALLNFGHTFGHAYEAIAGYDGRLLHGEAVALGMVRAMTLSMQMDQTNGADLSAAVTHLKRAGLPVEPASHPAGPFLSNDVIARMGHDKKTEAGVLNLILTKGIGQAYVAKNVDPDLVRTVL